MKTVFVIAGEPSGDALGGALMAALKQEAKGGVRFVGVGGECMEQQGLSTLLPMEELCVMGVWEVISHLPRLLKLINAMVEEIEKQQPDIVLTIDLPDFNFQVAKRLKKRGISNAKIVHYVAPSVWAWRPGRAKKISKFLDGLMCLFPFEPEYFKKYNLSAEFVGHPLAEKVIAEENGKSFRTKNQIKEDEVTLGLFLGSRPSEIKKHAKIMIDAVRFVHEQHPKLHVIVPSLPSLEYEVSQLAHEWDFPVTLSFKTDLKYDAFAACDIALAVSGTVALELAYASVPHVIAYKMHPVSWLVIRMLVKVKYAHLANILLNRQVIPEFLQKNCKAKNIAKGLLRILKNKSTNTEQEKDLSEIPALIGRSNGMTPSVKAARYILNLQ